MTDVEKMIIESLDDVKESQKQIFRDVRNISEVVSAQRILIGETGENGLRGKVKCAAEEIDSLKTWRNRIIGAGSAITIIWAIVEAFLYIHK